MEAPRTAAELGRDRCGDGAGGPGRRPLGELRGGGPSRRRGAGRPGAGELRGPDDVNLGLGPERLEGPTAGPRTAAELGPGARPRRSTAGPGAGELRDGPGSPVPPDATPRGPGAGRAPLRERPIEALPAPYSEGYPPQTVDPPVLGHVAPVRRVLDASTTPAGPIRVASSP